MLPFTVEHVFVAGGFEAALRRDDSFNRDEINSLAGDLLIASVPKERNATVVTRNPADFEPFGEVAVETY